MTQYERASLYLSGIAVVISVAIPLVQFIYHKIQRPRLHIIPFDGQPLTLSFDTFGPYAWFRFSIQCENESCIVKTIKLSICRANGESLYSAKWVLLKPIHVNRMFADVQHATIDTSTLVHPIRIGAGKLEPLNVEFEASVSANHHNLIQKLQAAVGSACLASQNADEVLMDQSVSSAIDELGKSCPWLEGDYTAEITILYDAAGSIARQYGFSITSDQAAALSDNAIALASALLPAGYPGMRKQFQNPSFDVSTKE